MRKIIAGVGRLGRHLVRHRLVGGTTPSPRDTVDESSEVGQPALRRLPRAAPTQLGAHVRLSRRLAVVLTAALLGPALPSLASTPGTAVVPAVVRSAALSLGATTEALAAGDQLVGVTWAAGAPQVRVRWLTAEGWTAWDVPDRDSDEPDAAERRGTRGGTEPLWRPKGARLVDVRVAGAATDLRLVRVGDGTPRTSRSWGTAAHADARSVISGVHSRADWGADESMRHGKPSYAAAVKAVVVHHTAGSNDYTQDEVPAKIRADYAYHVRARGWDDLGYNLVVDRFGGIWEGRAGGLGRATIGSHAQGFNTGTLGVSLLGDMTKQEPTREAVRAMARVSAYAAATWRFDPQGTVTLRSGGSPRYRSGTYVTLHRVFGHKDTGQTACPGALYDRLADIRSAATALVGPAPRILDVDVTGAPVRAPSPVVITGSLSRSAPWTAALRDAQGTVLARSAGEGDVARLEWNGLRPLPGVEAEEGVPGVLPATPGRYTWAINVDDGFHPAARREDAVEVALPLLPVG